MSVPKSPQAGVSRTVGPDEVHPGRWNTVPEDGAQGQTGPQEAGPRLMEATVSMSRRQQRSVDPPWEQGRSRSRDLEAGRHSRSVLPEVSPCPASRGCVGTGHTELTWGGNV